MAIICEACGVKNPKVFERGPFMGAAMELDYCEDCSMDLCDDCMATDACDESPDANHHPADDQDEE